MYLNTNSSTTETPTKKNDTLDKSYKAKSKNLEDDKQQTMTSF